MRVIFLIPLLTFVLNIFAEEVSSKLLDLKALDSDKFELENLEQTFELSEEDEEDVASLSGSDAKDETSEILKDLEINILQDGARVDSEGGQIDASYHKKAVIRVMNKITAKTQDLTLEIEEPIYWHNIELVLLKCYKKTDDEGEEHNALMKIIENKLDEDPRQIFLGWLFSKNKSINSVKHPIYYVDIIKCVD